MTLRILSFVQMCKFFSQYGMRSILVLYMVQSLHFSDTHAFGVNALFLGLLELGGILGGILADRYLGLLRATQLGAAFLSLGYMSFFFEKGLFLTLGLLILGGSLFVSNIAALLGAAFSDEESRRKGFTFFYVMQNLGAFISTIICPIVATHYGFRIGFLFASLGMVIGCILLFLFGRKLPIEKEISKRKRPLIPFPMILLILGLSTFAISHEEIFLPILPWASGGFFLFFSIKLLKDKNLKKESSRKFLIYLGALILFFAAADQICSSLVLFAERHVERTILGFTIPSSVIMSINPIVILIFASIVARRRSLLITPFLIVAFSFGILALFCLFHLGLSIFGIMGMVAFVSLAELMIGPMVSSMASEISVKGKQGTIMGMVPIAFSLSALLGGKFSKWVAVAPNSNSLDVYAVGFAKIALLTLIGGSLLQLLIKMRKNEKSRIY